MNKIYLSDSVYAEYNGFNIILTTENGFGASNTIILEPEVLEALDKYREHIKRELQRAEQIKLTLE
jgi:hypothetical protein